MILLNNGCMCSKPNVSPANWKTSDRSIKKKWVIHYRFYDPLFEEDYPKGYQICFSNDLNKYDDINRRREAANFLIDQLLYKLKVLDFNPITKEIKQEEDPDYIISPDTPINEALDGAFKEIDAVKHTKADVKSVLGYFKEATTQLRLDSIRIKDIDQVHVRKILDQIGRKKKEKWTANNFNYHRGNISILFSLLKELQAIKHNPVLDIKKKKSITKIREVLTKEERVRLDTELPAIDYRLWLAMHLFFHSGSRTTEFVGVKDTDIDVRRKVIKYTVLKGKYREVERPIKDIAMPYIMLALKGVKRGQYIFSKDLLPGFTKEEPEMFTKRWKEVVKDGMGIQKDWYALKHANTDEIDEIFDIAIAAKLNSHSPEIAGSVYAVGRKERQNALIRSASNTFAPISPAEFLEAMSKVNVEEVKDMSQ